MSDNVKTEPAVEEVEVKEAPVAVASKSAAEAAAERKNATMKNVPNKFFAHNPAPADLKKGTKEYEDYFSSGPENFAVSETLRKDGTKSHHYRVNLTNPDTGKRFIMFMPTSMVFSNQSRKSCNISAYEDFPVNTSSIALDDQGRKIKGKDGKQQYNRETKSFGELAADYNREVAAYEATREAQKNAPKARALPDVPSEEKDTAEPQFGE